MNKRIKELAEQAHVYANAQVAGTDLNVLDLFKEKFAKLIVRECMEQCVKVEQHDILYMDDPREAALLCRAAIKDHFTYVE